MMGYNYSPLTRPDINFCQPTNNDNTNNDSPPQQETNSHPLWTLPHLSVQVAAVRACEEHWDHNSFPVTEMTKLMARMFVTNFADTGGWHMRPYGQVRGGKTERWVNPMLFQPFPIDHGRSIHRRRLAGGGHDQRAMARARGASVYKLEQTDWDSLGNYYICTHLSHLLKKIWLPHVVKQL